MNNVIRYVKSALALHHAGAAIVAKGAVTKTLRAEYLAANKEFFASVGALARNTPRDENPSSDFQILLRLEAFRNEVAFYDSVYLSDTEVEAEKQSPPVIVDEAAYAKKVLAMIGDRLHCRNMSLTALSEDKVFLGLLQKEDGDCLRDLLAVAASEKEKPSWDELPPEMKIKLMKTSDPGANAETVRAYDLHRRLCAEALYDTLTGGWRQDTPDPPDPTRH